MMIRLVPVICDTCGGWTYINANDRSDENWDCHSTDDCDGMYDLAEGVEGDAATLP